MLSPATSSLAWKPRPEMRENLYHELEQRGSVLRLVHPRQTHQFHERQGLRAKTDRLDALTIAKVLVSGEARAGCVRSRTGHRLSRSGPPAYAPLR
jgi:transposase